MGATNTRYIDICLSLTQKQTYSYKRVKFVTEFINMDNFIKYATNLYKMDLSDHKFNYRINHHIYVIESQDEWETMIETTSEIIFVNINRN